MSCRILGTKGPVSSRSREFLFLFSTIFLLLLPSLLHFIPSFPSAFFFIPHPTLYLFMDEFKSEIQALILEIRKFSFDLPVSLFL